MDVISRFFALTTENNNSRARHTYIHGKDKNRIMNMALTTDMIAEAHATLNEIKELIAKIAKEKSMDKKNELCDKLA
jgi:hypothetical protein